VKAATLQAHDPRMVRLLAYLQAHLDEPLDIESLARLAGVSPRQLDRLFERIFGESPRACLRRLRLERAAGQLRRTRRRILAIALDAGFDSHESFTRSFARRFGHTPAGYRRLPSINLQPRDRGEYWRQALAGGLRRYVENKSRGRAEGARSPDASSSARLRRSGHRVRPCGTRLGTPAYAGSVALKAEPSGIV